MRKIFLQPSAAQLRAQCFGLLLVEKFLTCHKFLALCSVLRQDAANCCNHAAEWENESAMEV